MTTGNRDDEHCAYVYKKAELMRCGRTREQHRVAGLSHNFLDPATPIRQTITTQPTPESDEWREWYVASESSKDATIRAKNVGVFNDWVGQVKREHAAQIVADHNAVGKLVAAVTALRRSERHCWCQTRLYGDHEPECIAACNAILTAEGKL